MHLFKEIKIEGWRQFESIDIDLHSRLTIITGSNGTGKTTLLNILNQYFGWQSSFVCTPKRDKTSGIIKYLFDIWKRNEIVNSNNLEVGKIFYDDNSYSTLIVSNNKINQSPLYNLTITNKKNVVGIHIPSHSPLYKYSKVSNIPTEVKTRAEVFKAYNEAIKIDSQNYTNDYVIHINKTPTYIVKEMLISLATFGYGNEVIMSNSASINIFTEFENILRIVLPPKLSFEKIIIEMPEVLLQTKTGTFPIDAVSGGIAAIIDLAWQIFMFGETKFVITIDEPENHLHPEMQRSLLPNFLKAFPNVQFVIATHSPFIISSVLDSNVYVLDYNINDKVVSTKLDLVNKAGTANEILREVLGLPVTMPIWVENKIEYIVDKYRELEISNYNFDVLRDEMKEIGLNKYIPDTITKIVERVEYHDKTR